VLLGDKFTHNIIETGAGAVGLGLQGVQPKLSQLNRVCTYDCAGYGWSQPLRGSAGCRSDVRELHTLLNQVGMRRPLVLTGHSAVGSIGGGPMRRISTIWCASFDEKSCEFGLDGGRLMGNRRNTPSPELHHFAVNTMLRCPDPSIWAVRTTNSHISRHRATRRRGLRPSGAYPC
jgi:hypothetical protein